MPKSDTVQTVVDGVAVASGAGYTTTATLDISASYETVYHISIQNDTTNGPTTVGEVIIETSPDQNNWFEYGSPVKGITTANDGRETSVIVPMGHKYSRIKYGGNSGGGDVTYTVIETKVISI